jgi:hypothetical protein
VEQTDFVDHVLWMRAATVGHGGSVAVKPGYAPRTTNHAAAVISGFYDSNDLKAEARW